MSVEGWNVIGKWVAALAAIGTVAFGVFQYFDQRGLEIDQKKKQIEALERESKRVFLEKQFDLYTKAVAVVSRLATDFAYKDRDKDLNTFWRLYWGELGMVEDPQVERAMVEVGLILETIKTDDPPEEDKTKLERASLDLSYCVSKSLEDSWGFEFPTRECPY